MARSFASQGDLGEKNISFVELAPGAFGYTAEGDPNSGVIVGDEYAMIIEAQATPRMAEDVIAKVRSVTDKPIKYLVLTHYHAVRVLGASAYGASEIIASEKTWEMIVERGQQDWDSEFQRFPRLFRGHESIPGLTWPTITFKEMITIDLGNKRVQIMHLGEGHTRGDAVVWVPDDRVLYAGDLVEYGATPYCGDAQLENWPGTLDALSKLQPGYLVPGRGEALQDSATCQEAIDGTKNFVHTLYQGAKDSRARGESLKECYDGLMKSMSPQFGHWVIFEHCMCFNVSRAYDEAGGMVHPTIWTDERDMEMWEQLNG
jgi:glyoxylase-like metal-dependent hydrolase (beta-lactamase superfamily II)